MGKYQWIDESIKIDFELPLVMINLILDLEKFDIEDKECAYINYFDLLDTDAKNAYQEGIITREQWNLLLQKYGGF